MKCRVNGKQVSEGICARWIGPLQKLLSGHLTASIFIPVMLLEAEQ